MNEIKKALENTLFNRPGAYVLVDGQYGSTGKGVIAGFLAEMFHNKVDMVLSNAGPNSGHTSYYKGQKIVLKQLPTFGVISTLFTGKQMPVVLTAGAVIERKILQAESEKYTSNVFVHPNAAVVTRQEKDLDGDNVYSMASTGMGVGPAIINKLDRKKGNVFGCYHKSLRGNDYPGSHAAGVWLVRDDALTIFMEVSQGFSLGINSGFYPYVTTRECTVSQALVDAGMPPTIFRSSIMAIRTFPIRVGNTESSSGPCYDDQVELSWEDIGVEPEITTVTNRVRRVFTFSKCQFREALRANVPDVIFLNFMNYLGDIDREEFVLNNVIVPYQDVMNKDPILLLGHGPESSDVVLYKGRGART